MSLSRRITLVFGAVGAVILLLLVLNARDQAERATNAFRKEVVDPASRLTVSMVQGAIERALTGIATDTSTSEVLKALEIGSLPVWDEVDLRALLEKAVLVHSTPVDTTLYNPRPALIFEEAHAGGLDRSTIRDLVPRGPSIRLLTDSAGRRLAAGSFAGDHLTGWGFVFRLRAYPAAFDPASPVRSVVTILSLGLLAMLVVLLFVLRAAVLRPLVSLEHVALEIARGMPPTRLPYDARVDEIGSVSRAINGMAAEIETFRRDMESQVVDATERVIQAERQLIVTQRLAAMGQIAAGIAHEINNPLGGVINAVERLGRVDLPDERRSRYLRVAVDGLDRIRVIVGRVLATAPKKRFVEPVSIRSLFEQSIGLVAHRLRKENITLDCMPPSDDLVVYGDRRDLAQVLLNLLLNSCDAMQGQGGCITMRAAGLDGDNVVLTVKDDGPGVPAELRDQIFDLFFTTKPGHLGTGLGLGIVHNIITGHGGRIELVASEGRGAEFRVTLPRAPQES